MSVKSNLKIYRQRRELKKNSQDEPYGKIKKISKKLLFVIQKHDASHLHYDFRLEMNGVLKSWAVPKGLPSALAQKRLAIPTDDHPFEYARFEGIIPEGHYGGGTVMVWDIGTYENIKYEKGKLVPLDECYKRGTIEVFLNGKKLYGAYALIKTHGLSYKESWLAIKINPPEEFSKPIKAAKKKIKKDVSALTQRTMSQIAKDQDAVWE